MIGKVNLASGVVLAHQPEQLMKLPIKRPHKKAKKSRPFTKPDFERLVKKAIHPQGPKPDRGQL